jgi:hypothetical protein
MSKAKPFNLETIEVSMLPELQGWKEKQEAIVKENPFVAIIDNKTYEEAKKARTTLVSARITIEKQEKLIASKLKDFRTKVGDFSSQLITITLEHENKQQEEVRRYEAQKEAERLEKERKDQERKDLIASKIDAFYLTSKSVIESMTFQGIETFKISFEENLDKTDVTQFEEFELQFASKVQLLKQQLEDKIQVLTEKENQRVEAEKLAKEKAEFEAEKKAKELSDQKAAKELEDKQKAIEAENKIKADELAEKEKQVEKKAAILEEKEEILVEKEKALEEKIVAQSEPEPVLNKVAEIKIPVTDEVVSKITEVKTTKELIINTISDLVGAFTYYDRKEDEDLTIEKLNNAVKNNEITIDEMVAEFKKHLENIFTK